MTEVNKQCFSDNVFLGSSEACLKATSLFYIHYIALPHTDG